MNDIGEDIGDNLLFYLRKNPTVHELARVTKLTLEEAQKLQTHYVAWWQLLAKTIKEKR